MVITNEDSIFAVALYIETLRIVPAAFILLVAVFDKFSDHLED